MNKKKIVFHEKKYLGRMVSLLMAVLLCLSLTACGGGNNDGSSGGASGKAEQKTTTKDIFSDLDIREDIQTAIDCSRRISGLGMFLMPDGSYMFSPYRDEEKYYKNYAYSYFNEPVTAWYEDSLVDQVLAVMEDGSLYNGNTLISGGKVWDVGWQYGKGAYVLFRDGHIGDYDPHSGAFYESDKESMPEVTATAQSDRSVAFLKNGGVRLLSNSLPDEMTEKMLDNEYWKNVKNVVVGACSFDGDTNSFTLAAITADGQVNAVGDYADEILSMEDLSYIEVRAPEPQLTMGSQEPVIVGLTKEGKLRFAGFEAEVLQAYADTELPPIKGLKLSDRDLKLVAEDDSIYIMDWGTESDFQFRARSNHLTPDRADREAYRLDKNGDLYANSYKDETLKKVDEVNAGAADNHTDMIYYLDIARELRESEDDGAPSPFADSEYVMEDITGDGQDELIIKQKSHNWTKVYSALNGKMTIFAEGTNVEGFCPVHGMIVTSSDFDSGDGSEYSAFKIYYYYKRGEYSQTYENKVHRTEFSDPDRDDFYALDEETFVAIEEIAEDEEGKKLRQESSRVLSSGEFEGWYKNAVEDEKMQTLKGSPEPFTDSIQGLQELFLTK